MQKLNQQPDICPYFSPEFKVIPQYIVMKEGECMELNNKTTNFFIFILSGEITISFEQYTNRPVLDNENSVDSYRIQYNHFSMYECQGRNII